MQALFAPAIALMNRLGYTRKFAVLGALALVAVAVLLFNLYTALDQVIRKSETELLGIGAMRAVARSVQTLQQHRALSSGVLNGNDAMNEARATKENEVSDTLRTVEANILPALRDSAGWKQVVDEWEILRSDGLSLIVSENFAAHTRLIEMVLSFQAAVGDEYGLTNDPDIDSMYLIDTATEELPVALEHLGQLGARGTGILTRKLIVQQQQVDLATLLAELGTAVGALGHNLEKTVRYNPAMQAALEATAREMSVAHERITALIVDDIYSATFATAPADYFALTSAAIDQGYRQMFDTLFPALETLITQRIERARENLYQSVGITLLLLAVVAYFTIAIYYATINGILALAGNARTIATGDLRVRVDLGTRDELRLVADSLNEMVAAFSTLIRNVQSSTNQVHGASRQLAQSSSTITRSTERQSEAAASMAAAVEQMTVGIDHIAANADNANVISHHAGELSAGGGRAVGTVVREIEQIAAAVSRSATIVDALGEHSRQISAIINVIREIADQTNLLALNAAIEAARAGESGRGFAVVADEVRKLAERTATATGEISAMISAIQGGSQDAVESMKDGVVRVAQGVDLATGAGVSMNEIEASAAQVLERVAEISSALREQRVASAEIAKNVEHIAQMAEQNSVAVADNATTAVELERLSERLEAEVGRFKLG